MKPDLELAARLAPLLSRLGEKELARKPCRVSPETLLRWMDEGEKVLLLDVRTPPETSLVGFRYSHTLEVPLNELLTEENLKRLASYEGWKLVVACRSGVRSLVAAFVLRAVGFENAYSLEGGLVEFARTVRCRGP
ncbi:MAG: rhodanese-like domain-containing protein [Aquificae bacterium]|nr:rhodanese-like domain-containing protein [Aquificota bacterium]